eukprot:Em0013g175a
MSSTCSNLQECCNCIHIKRNGRRCNFSTLALFVILGKDESCDFRIQVPSVSSRHASLRVDKSGKHPTDSKTLQNTRFQPRTSKSQSPHPHQSLEKRTLLHLLPQNVSNTVVNSSKEKVPTPIIPRQHSVIKQQRRRSSLVSIPEQEEVISTPNTQLLVQLRSMLSALQKTRATSTPTPRKRKLESTVIEWCQRKSARKSVSFGPVLSPECFDKTLPPSTPIKVGALPGGIRRSLPAPLSKPSPAPSSTECSLLSDPEVVSSTEDEEDGETLDESVQDTEGEDTTASRSDQSTDGEGVQDADSDTGDEDGHDSEGEGTQEVEEDIQSTEGEDQECEEADVEYSMTGFEEWDSGSQVEESSGDEQSEVENSTNVRPETKKGLPTPLRRGIEAKPLLRKTKRAIPSPLKNEIESKPKLRRKMKRSLPTPLSKAIKMKAVLRKTKLMLSTPLRKAILQKPSLKRIKKPSMPTPVRKGIEAQPSLKKTKQTIPTPLKKDIEAKPSLKKTKQSMPTPVRKEGHRSTAISQEDQAVNAHTCTKGKTLKLSHLSRRPSSQYPTPLKKDIEAKPSLKKTKQSMPTPVRKGIEAQPSLKKTKQSIPTPLKKDIEAKPSLKKTKQSMPTPVRKGIEAQPSLKKTKQSMPTELQEAIQAGTILHTNKKSLPIAIRNALEGKPALRTTKRVLPAALCEEIVRGVKLKATKKCLPSLPPPLQAQIQSGVELQKTKLSMPLELRKGIETGAATLRHVSPKVLKLKPKTATQKKSTVSPLPGVRQAHKRVIGATDEAGETPLPLPPSKKRRLAAPASPQPFSFKQFVKDIEGSVDLSVIKALHSNSKVEFSASHTEMSLAELPTPSEPAPDTSLFQLGVESTRPNGVRAARSKTKTDGRSRNIRGKQKVGLTDSGTATKRITRSNARGVSDHTNEENGVDTMESAQTLVPTSALNGVPSGRKKATKNTSKTVAKVLLETIPEQPGPPEIDGTQKQESSHKPSTSEETCSMKQDRPKRGTKSLKCKDAVAVTHSETNIGLDPGNNNQEKPVGHLSNFWLLLLSQLARITRVSRKVEVPICAPEEYVEQDVSLQGAHSKKKLKVEHTSVDEMPKKVTRSSKQDKVSVEILPQETAPAIVLNTDIPVSVREKKKRGVEQDTIGSEAGKTKRPLRSSKQDDGCVEQNADASEEPPSTKKRKVEKEKPDRTTRSVKQMDIDVILEGSKIEPVPTKQKRATRSVKSNPTDEHVMHQESIVNLFSPTLKPFLSGPRGPLS